MFKQISFIIKILLFFFLLISPLSVVRAENAALFLSPQSGTFIIGNEFDIAVKINSGDQNINAADGVINFDSGALQVVAIIKKGSIFDKWITEPVFSNDQGSISFSGGVPQPGYAGNAGDVFSIKFVGKKVGSTQLNFSSGSILANDGKGSNVLVTMGNASFIIAPKINTPNLPQALEQTAPSASLINSPTHLDQFSWYNKPKVKLAWDLSAEDKGVSFAIDKAPLTDPGNKSDGLVREKEYENLEDGIWYFHLKIKKNKEWEATNHFRVQIDTRPPTAFSVTLSQDDPNDWPILTLSATDELSGLDKYQVILNNSAKDIISVSVDDPKLKLPNLQLGTNIILAKAIDRAGNEIVISTDFILDPLVAPVVKNFPAEIKINDKFYLSGTSLPNQLIILSLQPVGGRITTQETISDGSGNWLLVYDQPLPQGRYVFWVEGKNSNGLASEDSSQNTFSVAPTRLAKTGAFISQYFTVFASLLFLALLIIVLFIYVFDLIRRKLKKETIEVEHVLRQALENLKKNIEQEFIQLEKFENSSEYRKEKLKTKLRLKQRVELLERGILKEVKDVEKILK